MTVIIEDQIFEEVEEIQGDIFLDCQFIKCDLSDQSFQGKTFSSCVFNHCNCSLINWTRTQLKDVSFNHCKIMGGDFFKCDPTLLSIFFDQCHIQYANFSGMILKNTRFTECLLQECLFKETNLTKSNFSQSNLAGSTFHHTNLRSANFSGSTNYSINPTANDLAKATFSFPEAIKLLDGF
ncbi:pentapeptide repeat-containing protein, partial [Chlamydiales bacterium]|nr:pentapeptide repeat-containing protein [Chlamydiales bacterium]